MITALGVVIPAHDEEELIEACLEALRLAIKQPGVPSTRVVVVADDCHDRTAQVAFERGAAVLAVNYRNAGAARAHGFDYLLEDALDEEGELWLCTTDADSRVPANWLLHQLEIASQGYDAMAGTVAVTDWSPLGKRGRRRFTRRYGPARDGHQHVHGANLGFSAAALRAIGGFPPLALAEDHALVKALTRHQYRVCRTGGAPVVTSARKDWRAPKGFGALLTTLDAPAWRRLFGFRTSSRRRRRKYGAPNDEIAEASKTFPRAVTRPFRYSRANGR